MPRRLLAWNARTWLRLGAYLLLAAVMAVGFYRLNQANIALCAQRDDLDEQIRQTANLLDETAGQPFVFAIPRQLIADGQNRSIATRENLDGLSCG